MFFTGSNKELPKDYSFEFSIYVVFICTIYWDSSSGSPLASTFSFPSVRENRELLQCEYNLSETKSFGTLPLPKACLTSA